MAKILAAGLAWLMIAGAAQAQTTRSYTVDNQDQSGASGSHSATVTDSVGDRSTITFAGGVSPRLTVSSSVPTPAGTHTNTLATFTYAATLTTVAQHGFEILYSGCLANAQCGAAGGSATKIGAATGSFGITGTENSFGRTSVQVGDSRISGYCDAGQFGNACGTHDYTLDVYVTQDWLCPSKDVGGACTSLLPVPPLVFMTTLSVQADLGQDAGSQQMTAFADPVFTLNDGFFTSLGLDPRNYGLAFSATTERSGGVPEPASWALMVLGFGGLGAVLRNRRRGALAA
jgi:hypothetical protein